MWQCSYRCPTCPYNGVQISLQVYPLYLWVTSSNPCISPSFSVFMWINDSCCSQMALLWPLCMICMHLAVAAPVFYHRFQWLTASRDTCVRLQIRLQKIQQTTRTQQCLHHVFSSSMCPLWPSWPGTRRHSNPTYTGHLRGQLLFLNVVSHFPTFGLKLKRTLLSFNAVSVQWNSGNQLAGTNDHAGHFDLIHYWKNYKVSNTI